jgi:hypothetical protein
MTWTGNPPGQYTSRPVQRGMLVQSDDKVAIMNLPVTFPDWVPWWVPLILLLPALLYALAFLFMPFSVIGLKNRLEVMEARLDEIQNEIRHLSLRLPAPEPERPLRTFDEGYVAHTPPRPTENIAIRPPIPPAPHELLDEYEDDHDGPPLTESNRPVRPRAEVRTSRSEPRLNWRR